jgi:hypothetical protein
MDSQSSYAISTKNCMGQKKNTDTRKGSGIRKVLASEKCWHRENADTRKADTRNSPRNNQPLPWLGYSQTVVAGDLLFKLLYYAKVIWAGGRAAIPQGVK